MNLKIHFLSVGNGDCTVIELPDSNIMVVDICNGGNGSSNGLTDPVEYLSKVSTIFRYVQTHPEMDHMEGLARLSGRCAITNFWDTAHTRPRPDFSGRFTIGRPEDWDAYQRLRASAKTYYRGIDRVTLQGAGQLPYDLYVLHPTETAVQEANRAQDWNRLSYVLLLKYRDFKLLLGGDADDGSWEEIFTWAAGNSVARGLLANIDVFKVSHHGRRSGYCGINMLRLTSPKYIVISKGSVPGEQSAYGSYYNRVGAERLLLTSQGTIVVSYDETTNRFSVNQ